MIPPPLVDAAAEVQAVLSSHRLRSCVIGGLAVHRWGERQGRKLDVDRIRRYGALFADLKEDPDLLRPLEVSLARARD